MSSRQDPAEGSDDLFNSASGNPPFVAASGNHTPAAIPADTTAQRAARTSSSTLPSSTPAPPTDEQATVDGFSSPTTDEQMAVDHQSSATPGANPSASAPPLASTPGVHPSASAPPPPPPTTNARTTVGGAAAAVLYNQDSINDNFRRRRRLEDGHEHRSGDNRNVRRRVDDSNIRRSGNGNPLHSRSTRAPPAHAQRASPQRSPEAEQRQRQRELERLVWEEDERLLQKRRDWVAREERRQEEARRREEALCLQLQHLRLQQHPQPPLPFPRQPSDNFLQLGGPSRLVAAAELQQRLAGLAPSGAAATSNGSFGGNFGGGTGAGLARPPINTAGPSSIGGSARSSRPPSSTGAGAYQHSLWGGGAANSNPGSTHNPTAGPGFAPGLAPRGADGNQPQCRRCRRYHARGACWMPARSRCRNCGEKGHKMKECSNPRRGPG